MTSTGKVYLKPISEKAPTIIPDNQSMTIGRSESCDITIDNTYLSQVHASVLLDSSDSLSIHDLKSTNGIYLNGEKRDSFVAKVGDKVQFASVEYFVEVVSEDAKEVFDEEQTKSILRRADIIRKLVGNMPPVPGGEVPRDQQAGILEIFPEFEFTEFIFEENVKGKAFRHNKNSKAVEVTVLFGNYIYSVEYFSAREKVLKITGDSFSDSQSVYLPLLSLLQDKTLISHENNKFYIHDVFDSVDLYDNGRVTKNIFNNGEERQEINDKELVIAKLKEAILYFKITKAPPQILGYSRFLSDKLMAFLILLSAFMWLGVSTYLSGIEITEKELEKVVVDRILYVKSSTTTLPAPTTTTTLEKISNVETSKPTKENLKAEKLEKSSSAKSSEVARVEPKVKAVSQSQSVLMKRKDAIEKEVKTIQKPVEEVKVSEKAKIQTNLKSKLSALKNKYSKYTKKNKSNLSTSKSSQSHLLNSSFNNSKSTGKASSLIKAKQRGFNPIGKSIGALGKSKTINSSGISNKISKIGNILGGRTVVLGSLDPNDIKKLLKENTPRFSYCYEKELERKGVRKRATIVTEFTILQGGIARNISVTSNNLKLSSRAIRCFKTVIARINFPSPRGGGKVGVKQPFSLEPR